MRRRSLTRSQATFRPGLQSRYLPQRLIQMDFEWGGQSEAYRILFEEHKQFQAHAKGTTDEYKAFVDSQNDGAYL